MFINRSMFLLVCLIVALSGGCGNSENQTNASELEPNIIKPQELVVALVSTDLAVGENRVAFGVIRPGYGPIKNAEVQVQSFLMNESEADEPKETVKATFREWPQGSGGVYVTRLHFSEAGVWGIGVLLSLPDGSNSSAATQVEVRELSLTPAVGAPAIPSSNKISRDVPNLVELTTDIEPDPDLYAITIADALRHSTPFLVSFSTPAYCQTATCGPQLAVIKELKKLHMRKMRFLHVEVYDNPHEIQGDLTRGRLSPTLAEWGLPTEPWTFVVDSGGLIQEKFEGFVSRSELEKAILKVVQ